MIRYLREMYNAAVEWFVGDGFLDDDITADREQVWEVFEELKVSECTVDPEHRVDVVAAVVAPEYDYPWRIDHDASEWADRNPPLTKGSGTLRGEGWDTIKREIDPDDLDEKTHVADIIVDLTVWNCCVRWTDAGEELRDGGIR